MTSDNGNEEGRSMSELLTGSKAPTAAELEQMDTLYREGGARRQMAPPIIYQEAGCPHPGCGQRLQGIDFRLEAYGPAVHDPLVRAWWADVGFVGRCPKCGGWIHFTIRGKRAITAEEAAQLPQLPDDWHATALIL
jgi:hypothetical protein